MDALSDVAENMQIIADAFRQDPKITEQRLGGFVFLPEYSDDGSDLIAVTVARVAFEVRV